MGRKLKFVADDKIPFLNGVFERYADVTYKPGALISNHDVRDADALIVRTRTLCNEALLKGSTIKFVATATIGHDHIDHHYLSAQGIAWCRAPGCNAGSVMQYVTSAIFHLATLKNIAIDQMVLGIIGVGHVGKAVAKMAEAVGIKTLLNDPPRARLEPHGNFVSLDEIAAQSNIITVHVPLQRDGQDCTLEFLAEPFFAKLRQSPIFINSSRGEVVNETDLKQAILDKKISATALDVWQNEPAIDANLLGLADLATAHIAGYSLDGKANGTAMVVQDLARFFGLPLDNWRPSQLTPPAQPLITIDRSVTRLDEILRHAAKHSFDIDGEDKKLRSRPESFENIRNHYPVRREFGNYQIISGHLAPAVTQRLRLLGFECI
jgi:erythronate-4-phosphate dehydrogenase